MSGWSFGTRLTVAGFGFMTVAWLVGELTLWAPAAAGGVVCCWLAGVGLCLVGAGAGAADWWARRRARAAAAATAGEVRPRFGTVWAADGTSRPIVFRQDPTDPTLFVALDAGDETPVAVPAGGRLTADVIGPGQAIVARFQQ